MTEKENLNKSMGVGVSTTKSGGGMDTQDSQALYQFLKSKHLSKDIQ
jgi:hypothetical protein